MRKAANQKVNHIFQRETAILKHSKVVLEKDDISTDELKKELSILTNHYEELLDQSKLITKVSDRQQKKIIRTSEALEANNKKLQVTIDALTKAKVGRKATTITLGIAIVLFLFSEGFLEPIIDKWVDQHDLDAFMFERVNFIGLGLKAMVALLIRPIEKLVENRMMAQAMKEENKQKEQ